MTSYKEEKKGKKFNEGFSEREKKAAEEFNPEEKSALRCFCGDEQ